MKDRRTILIFSAAFLLGVCVSFLGYLVIHQYKISRYAASRGTVEAVGQESSGPADAAGEREYIDTVFRQLDASVHEAVPGIVCWGDSLTAGAGGGGVTYETVLHDLIRERILSQINWDKFVDGSHRDLLDTVPEGYGQSYSALPDIQVANMGVGGEDSRTILGRSGAVPFVLAKDIVIPSSSDQVVEVELQGGDGERRRPWRQGAPGMRGAAIAGIKGVLKLCQESATSPECTYFFSREYSGEETAVKAGTALYTEGAEAYTEYLPVIFMGQNGGWDEDPQVLIEQQRAMLDHQKKNNDRFIIIGLHTGTADERKELEAAMQKEWGDKYINLREYMSGEALEEMGIEPTARDREMREKGMTPESFLASDGVHFNEFGYRAIGSLLYARMDELGYFDGVREAVERVNAME